MQQTGVVADRPRTGHPSVTSRREDRHIGLRHLRNRFETAASTSRHLFRCRVSQSTIRNRLRTAGLRARRPYTQDPFSRHFTVVNVWNGPDDTVDGISNVGITLSLVTSHVSHLGLLMAWYGCDVGRENAMSSVVFMRLTDLVAAA